MRNKGFFCLYIQFRLSPAQYSLTSAESWSKASFNSIIQFGADHNLILHDIHSKESTCLVVEQLLTRTASTDHCSYYKTIINILSNTRGWVKKLKSTREANFPLVPALHFMLYNILALLLNIIKRNTKTLKCTWLIYYFHAILIIMCINSITNTLVRYLQKVVRRISFDRHVNRKWRKDTRNGIVICMVLAIPFFQV